MEREDGSLLSVKRDEPCSMSARFGWAGPAGAGDPHWAQRQRGGTLDRGRLLRLALIQPRRLLHLYAVRSITRDINSHPLSSNPSYGGQMSHYSDPARPGHPGKRQ